ncbi:hypothetical protein EJB05_36105, partial [Eragrostis curvula]
MANLAGISSVSPDPIKLQPCKANPISARPQKIDNKDAKKNTIKALYATKLERDEGRCKVDADHLYLPSSIFFVSAFCPCVNCRNNLD